MDRHESTRAADRIEQSVHDLRLLFDPGYGGIASRLVELLELLEQQDRCASLAAELESTRARLAASEKAKGDLLETVMNEVREFRRWRECDDGDDGIVSDYNKMLDAIKLILAAAERAGGAS